MISVTLVGTHDVAGPPARLRGEMCMGTERDWSNELRQKSLNELRRLATEDLPQDPNARQALAAELKRRAAEVKQAASSPIPPTRNEVVVTDIQMSFGSMVLFMVMWTIASLPAMVILAVIGGILYLVLRVVAGFVG